MQRFFISPEHFQSGQVLFPADISHQITRVLRLQTGDSVVVLDNQGHEFDVEVTQVNAKGCLGTILAERIALGEPSVQIHLLVAVTQREKFEWILQKCTEVGVTSITPLLTERSLVGKAVELGKKGERWERIIREAAEQSRRGRIPQLRDAMLFQQAVKTQGAVRLLAWEGEEQRDLRQVLIGNEICDVYVLIGPEGGFSMQEAQQAEALGWKPFSMGKRIMRMETAAVVACALILFHMGEI